MPVEHARVKALFFEAMDQPAHELGPWLRAAAGGDAALYDAVAELLDFHDDAPLFGGLSGDRPGGAEATAGGPEDVDPLGIVGTVLADRLAVRRYVAEGGFAFVYQAEDSRGGEPRALKLFKEVDPDERGRLEAAFRREAALLARLAHQAPTLVRSHGLLHWTTPGGRILLGQELEWLDGAELDVPPGGRGLAELLDLLDPVADALAAVHAAGIAHRDVKPANVFVQPDGRVRLLDLGIAKVAHDRARGFASTATASSAFTLHYAAPEQLTNRATGPWTDVYALAVVVVEQLAGRHPYAHQSPLETMMVLADPHRRPSPRSIGLAVEDAVEDALLAALAVAPGQRPDVAGLWSALRAAAGAAPQ